MHFSAFRQSNADELRAFDDACDVLQGFDEKLNSEFVDGFLTALATGLVVPPADLWLPAMCGDAFERAFADPVGHAAALRALKTRLAVLRDQLDPEALMADEDAMRLTPLMLEWTDESRAELMAEMADQPGLQASAVTDLRTGCIWAGGFISATLAMPDLWQAPQADAEAVEDFNTLLRLVVVLWPPEDEELVQNHIKDFYAVRSPPSREELVNDAIYAVQDFRLFWIRHAPKPATRHMDKTPGRNDICFCGSGKKYKKCHGMAESST